MFSMMSVAPRSEPLGLPRREEMGEEAKVLEVGCEKDASARVVRGGKEGERTRHPLVLMEALLTGKDREEWREWMLRDPDELVRDIGMLPLTLGAVFRDELTTETFVSSRRRTARQVRTR